jgi:hypothetical protein
MKNILCGLLAAIYLSGCTTMSQGPYPTGSNGSALLQSGDRVLVTTSSGTRELTVTSASADEVCGANECIRAAAVTQVQRQEVSALKTAGLIVLVLLVGLVAASRTPAFFPGPPVL